MTGTDEARKLLQAFAEDLRFRMSAVDTSRGVLRAFDKCVADWLAANPESKPDAGVTKERVAMAAKAYADEVCIDIERSAEEAHLAGLIKALAAAVPAPETIPEQTHDWFVRDPADGFQCCRKCGIVRRADDKNKPCRGIVRVGLRAAAPAVSQPPADTRETGNG